MQIDERLQVQKNVLKSIIDKAKNKVLQETAETYKSDPVSAYEIVKNAFKLPFEARPYQIKAINENAAHDACGYFLAVGTGKTYCSTIHALYNVITYGQKVVVIVPPTLISQWVTWLKCIEGVSAIAYRGLPDERQKIKLNDAMFTVVGYQIFLKDFDRFNKAYGKGVTIIADEATAIKNPKSKTFNLFSEFQQGKRALLLTGTPLSRPSDAYSYIKIKTPLIYRSHYAFERRHVAGKDERGNPQSYRDLDLLKTNFALRSVTITQADALPWLPKEIYNVIPYDLDARHLDVYKQLRDMMIIELENTVIDGTTPTRLRNQLQQIILNWQHFDDAPGPVSGFELMDSILDSIGDQKLVVYANYRMTLASLIERYPNAVLYNGDATAKQKEEALHRFINDPSCRIFAANPLSGGIGTDGLQKVCSNMLFLELPLIPKDFEQAVGRLKRSGQSLPPVINVAIANGTIQGKLYKDLIAKDELTRQVHISFEQLKKLLMGE